MSKDGKPSIKLHQTEPKTLIGHDSHTCEPIMTKDWDWCHLCGRRRTPTLDIWYPENAEHQELIGPRSKNTRYIRVCKLCVSRMQHLLS